MVVDVMKKYNFIVKEDQEFLSEAEDILMDISETLQEILECGCDIPKEEYDKAWDILKRSDQYKKDTEGEW
jgi:hypothetical protein